MRSKLGLDKDVIARARHFARNIAADTQSYIDLHTTVAVERTVLRLLGVNGVDANDVPMPNVVVEHMTNRGLLAHGAAALDPLQSPSAARFTIREKLRKKSPRKFRRGQSTWPKSPCSTRKKRASRLRPMS